MRALVRLAAIAVSGATLYFAGIGNSQVIYRPSALGAVAVTLAIGSALALLVLALRGTGQGDAGAAPDRRLVVPLRFTWLFISFMALVSLAWLSGAPRERSYDWTSYHNDALALNECAARLLIEGRNPYVELDLFSCYERIGIGPDRTTPLRRGLFADVRSYPTDDQLDAAWAARASAGDGNEEFVSRQSYPALSIALLVPWVALGWDTNVFYLLCLLAAMSLVAVRTDASLRPFMVTALLGATSLVAFTVGGSVDLLYALPLVAAWLWRERRWSAVLYGIAAATKQLAWFFAPFFLMQAVAAHGWREAARRSGLAAGVFAATNLPFVLADSGAWLAGILTPVLEPMFPRGAGLVFLSTNGVLPLLPSSAYLALEALAGAGALAFAWRTRRTSPELGVVLAVAPLFFAHRSLFSYFFLLPLFAFAGLSRMPLGSLSGEAARATGGLTLLAALRRSPRAGA